MSFAFFLERRLQDVFKTFDQDEYIRLSLRSSEDAFKTSSRRLGQDQYIRLGHMSSRLFQDFFKTSSRRLAKIPSRRFQDVFKLFFLTRLGEVFNPFLILSFPKGIYRGISLGNTTSEKFDASVQNLQEK